MYIDRESAVGFWRTVGPDGLAAAPPSRVKLTDTIPSAKTIALHRIPGSCLMEGCLQVAVPDVRSRRHVPGVDCHVMSRPMPDGAFRRIADGLYVASPELCLLQMASILPPHEAVVLGMEFCGAYSLAPETERGFVLRPPLTSVDKVRRLAARAYPEGSRASCLAFLPWLLDGSASPAETAQVMLLCLPPRLGGYGLPKPLLNYEISFTPDEQLAYGVQRFVCDMFFPKASVAVEYDSRTFHTEIEKQERDASRRNLLESKGITVVVTTRNKLYDAWGFDRHARQIARLIKKTLYVDRPGFIEKRAELRKAVLSQGCIEKKRRSFLQM